MQPYHLARVESRWYVIGFDPERGDIRTFLLSRMSSLGVALQRFNRPAAFDVEHYLSSSLCIMCGAGDYRTRPILSSCPPQPSNLNPPFRIFWPS